MSDSDPHAMRRALRPEMTLRQLAMDFPAAEAVLRKYGEPGDRAAPFGHLEPLHKFAARRNLDLATLLEELSQTTGVPVDRTARFAERIHRPFLLAALAVTLTLGTGWGAWLLWRIGMQGDFDAVPAASIVAHGEAQLWGFVVLFVLGVSLRTVLQPAARLAAAPALATALWGLAVAGVAGSLIWSLAPAQLPMLGVASGVAWLLLAMTFWLVQWAVLWRKWDTPWARAILLSGCWLLLWATATLELRWQAAALGPGAYSETERILLIELAVFGFAINAIYGFGQVLLPGLLRLGKPRHGALEGALVLHNLGTLALCLAARLPHASSWAVPGSLLVAGGAVAYAIGQRAFWGKPRGSRRLEQGHPALDLFMPLAFLWLLISLGLLAAGHLAQAAGGPPLSHAYTGAVRHALTVGFMTTLIMGVAQRVVPVFERTVLPRPGLVWPMLLLIGLGNLWRVGSELAVAADARWFAWMPASALMEWTALLLFAISITATIWHRDPLLRHGQVTRLSSLAVLLAERPWMEDELLHAGSRYLARVRSVPSELTLDSFARSEDWNPEQVVRDINHALQQAPPSRRR